MTSEDKQIVDCGTALTIANAANIHDDLKKAIGQSSVVELKVSDVEKVDTAGLQLLISFKKEIDQVSGKIEWNKPSEVLQQSVVTLGLANVIDFSA